MNINVFKHARGKECHWLQTERSWLPFFWCNLSIQVEVPDLDINVRVFLEFNLGFSGSGSQKKRGRIGCGICREKIRLLKDTSFLRLIKYYYKIDIKSYKC